MIHRREVRLYLVAVAVGRIYRGHVACHDLFAEDIPVTLNLASHARAAVTAVEHARVRLLVAYSPHHPLQYQRRIGLLALHEGEYHVLVGDEELAHILCYT